MNNIELAKIEIAKIIKNSVDAPAGLHSTNTLEWLLKIKPDSDEALQIAALAHDIERGFNGENRLRVKSFANYDEYKEAHSLEGSLIIGDLLEMLDFDEDFVNRVQKFVLNHEIGGDEETNILMDADSLSYMEVNFDYYLQYSGIEKTRFKLDYMYDRMTERGKIVGKELYQRCLKKLIN
ncbi:MAG: hypothetical protein ACD_72C00254G0005 [uncultured bacterium]|nr:MAG: hypothetical protein ACD_72C00254G0005 [uncultured bacterium]